MTTPTGVGQQVLFETSDHIAMVTLNRPEKRNAINGAVAEALDWIVKQVEADDDIRVAILASSLDTTFCAGADLAEIAAGNGASLQTKDGGFAGFVDAKRSKPWIAAVRGSALGLVNRLAATDSVLDTARELAGEIAVNAPMSVRESLVVARLAQETSDSDMRTASTKAAMRVMTSDDAKEKA